jgi:hypothetical protein
MTMGRRWAVSGLVFTLIGWRALLAEQSNRLPSAQPNPRLPPRIMPDNPGPVQHADPILRLKENLKNLRSDVDQLVQLAQDLKTESDKTNQTEVLSLTLVHKADDVEKLAKKIKSLAHAS